MPYTSTSFDPPGGFGGETGLWTDTGDANLYTPAWNNRFAGNTYHDTTPGTVFDWGISGQYTTQLTWAQWQAAGQDTTGSLLTDDPATPPPPTLVVGPQP